MGYFIFRKTTVVREKFHRQNERLSLRLACALRFAFLERVLKKFLDHSILIDTISSP